MEQYKNITIKITDQVSIEMVFVEGDTFMMGSPDHDKDAYDQEKPQHAVQVPSFYMGKYQVTQALWKAIMGNNPSYFKGDLRPVERVSWNDTKEFLTKINHQMGQSFRLPTEAEWEFAAKGGIKSEGYLYSGSDKLRQVGWYRENSGRETHVVGELMANELGIYDMSGNVWEWCEDDWYDHYRKAPNDGSARVGRLWRGAYRVIRGGSYFSYAVRCRATNRDRFTPGNRNDSLGFRLALSPQSVG